MDWIPEYGFNSISDGDVARKTNPSTRAPLRPKMLQTPRQC